MHWYKWFPGDYQRDTLHLSFVEDAAYRRMLDHYYMHGKLSAIADDLLRVCRAITPDEQKAVQRVADEFFEHRDGFLFHQKVEDAIAKNRATSGFRSNAGKKGANKTNSKRSANAAAIAATSDAANAEILPPIFSANGSAIPEPENITTADQKSAKSVTGSEHEFDAMWAEYPKRLGDNPKARALKAWKARITSGHTPAEILAGVKRYAAYAKARGIAGTEYVKQAATFLGPDKGFLEEWLIPAGADAGSSQAPDFMRGAI